MPLTQVSTNGIKDQAVTNADLAFDGGALGARNLIINGDMRIDQRTAGASQLLADTGVYKVDRWSIPLSVPLYSKLTAGRDLNAVALPAGFASYLGLQVTTAATPGATDFGQLRQAIEGFNIAGLDWGTAGARPVTLSFRVRSSVTGTYAGVLQNTGSAYTYAFNYTVSAANTWETKTVTVPGPTVGSWPVGNGIGIYVIFNLGTGSNQTTSTVGSWVAGNFLTTTGTVNLVANAGATWYVTGVQLEQGPAATPFERRSYGHEVTLCQRYFHSFVAYLLVYTAGNGTGYAQTITYPEMRDAPSVATSGASYLNSSGVSVSNISRTKLQFGAACNNAGGVPVSVNATLALSAEL